MLFCFSLSFARSQFQTTNNIFQNTFDCIWENWCRCFFPRIQTESVRFWWRKKMVSKISMNSLKLELFWFLTQVNVSPFFFMRNISEVVIFSKQSVSHFRFDSQHFYNLHCVTLAATVWFFILCVCDKKIIIIIITAEIWYSCCLLRWYFNNTRGEEKKTRYTHPHPHPNPHSHTKLTENKTHGHKVCIYVSEGESVKMVMGMGDPFSFA